MNSKKFIYLFFFTLIPFFSFSQSTAEFKNRFENARHLFGEGKYELAMEIFKDLTQDKPNNPYQEYASFYYALSAYRANFNFLAKNMFLQIKTKSPGWEKIDEVNYWLGLLYFEDGKWEEGLEALQDIKDQKLSVDTRSLKLNYLGKIESVDSLSNLLEEFPQDKTLARLLADKILAQPLMNRDQKQLDYLIKEYQLEADRFQVATPERSPKKDEYNVAVLLPFMYRELAGMNTFQKNLVLELYEGIKLSVSELQKNGVNLNLYAYDTRKDSLTTARLLSRPEMKGMDLIIGPLTLKPLELVANFAYQNQINMINPLSYNSKIIGSNPYAYLFFPSWETQAKQTAKFTAERFNLYKKALLFYGGSSSDSLIASIYRQQLRDLNYEVPVMKRFRKSEAKGIFDFFMQTIETPELEVNKDQKPEFLVSLDSVDVILLASDSDDGMLMANLIGGLEARTKRVPVVSSEEFLDASFLLPEQMQRLDVHLISPRFIDFNDPEYVNFRNFYLQQTRTLPSRYASVGYDLMTFYGNMLNQYGKYFQLYFDELGFEDGILLPGYNFDNSQDNKFVPIIRFENAELKLVNDFMKFSSRKDNE